MKFTKKKIIIGIVILLIIAVSAYAKFGPGPKTEYVTAKVEKGKLVQSVSQTGTVKAVSELNLNFLNSGKLARIAVAIGDKVKRDQVLAELDHAQLSIKEKQAEANLSKLVNGATPQDVAIAESAYRSALTDYDKTRKAVNENIAQAKKNYDDITKTTIYDVTNYEQAVTTAQVALDSAKKTYRQNLDNRLDTALSVAGDKLNVSGIALDNINKILTDENAKVTLSIKDPSYLDLTKLEYQDGKNLTDSADAKVAPAKTSRDIDETIGLLDSVFLALDKTSDALDDCYKSLENTVTTNSYTQANLDAAKAAISGQQTIVSGAIASVQSSKQALNDAELSYNTNITSAENNLKQAQVSLANAIISAKNAYNSAVLTGDQQIASAQSRLDSAKTQLDKIKAPARREDIVLAQADLDSVRSQISNSIIKAPIDGIITKSNYEVGEDVNPSLPAISMLGENNLEIEILISEADIIKISLGQKGETTFDAFPSDIKFATEVYFIEPAETIVQGVVYYNVKVKLTDLEEVEKKAGDGIKVKSGMTANVVIITNEKNDVLKVPARAVVEKADGTKVVRILVDDKMTEVPVTVGLRGDEGMTEIISPAIREGDLAVTSVK